MKNLIKKYMFKYAPLFILQIILLVSTGAITLFMPYINKLILDKGVLALDFNITLKYIVYLVIATIVYAIIFSASNYINLKLSVLINSNLRSTLFKKVLNFSFSNLDDIPPSTIFTRITNDTNSVTDFLTNIGFIFIYTPFVLIFSVVFLFKLHAKLTLILLGALPFLALIVLLFYKMLVPAFKAIKVMQDKMNKFVEENISLIKVIKTYSKEKKEIKNFESINFEYMKVFQVSVFKIILFMLIINTFFVIVNAIEIAMSSKYIFEGSFSIGDLVAYIAILNIVLMTLISLVNLISTKVSAAFTSSKRITEIFEVIPTIEEKENAIKEIKNLDIEFKNVSFHYPKSEKMVLNNISFKLKEGQSLGIIGETGSGKSSLIGLIPRFYDVTDGQILIGNIDIKDYAIDTLQNSISAVFQDISIFSESIYENITLKKLDENNTEDINKINEIISDCCISDMINNMPYRIETKLAEEGKNLSGGQKQRIALARALYNNFKLLILDDTTSAIDKITEKSIQNILNTKYSHVSKIIISQKISSIISCDKILVLSSDGKIENIGTHEELLSSSPIYKEIYNISLLNN